MAKWTVNPGTVNSSIKSEVHYDRHNPKEEIRWQMYQDEKPFIEAAKREREQSKYGGTNGYKKFATIPDIVAIEIAEKYGINIHDPETLHDKDKMNKFRYIISTHYKYLMSY